MKKTIKRALIGLSVFIGILLTAAIVFMINFLSATKAMTPAETHAINDSVWCIKDRFVNAYIFKGKNSYLMVDAGIRKASFKKELDKIGINPGQIATILLTHTDGDHIGAIPLFKNISIYMHRDEEQMINGTTGKSKFHKPKWKYGPYKLLESNDTITIDGIKVKILLTPGHTPGSSCYIIGNEYLLTGDNLIIRNGNYSQFYERFNMDTKKQLESLKLLPSPVTFKYILTGHDGITEINSQ
jgi:hydroxyacylglutathione hydrolase